MENNRADISTENPIELYYKASGLIWVMFWLSFGALMFAGLMGSFVPFMWFTDESMKGYSELNGYVIFIAICSWIIAAVIFLFIRHQFHTFKRRHIPIILDTSGVKNLPSSRSAAKTINMSWEDITKIARSASIPGARRSFHKDRLGTLTAFYTIQNGKTLRCMIDWALLGFKGMREEYKQAHYFIYDHAVEDCTLESYPTKWPEP